MLLTISLPVLYVIINLRISVPIGSETRQAKIDPPKNREKFRNFVFEEFSVGLSDWGT
jgi:hypothetical protein